MVPLPERKESLPVSDQTVPEVEPDAQPEAAPEVIESEETQIENGVLVAVVDGEVVVKTIGDTSVVEAPTLMRLAAVKIEQQLGI